jgi:hypothetical protein
LPVAVVTALPAESNNEAVTPIVDKPAPAAVRTDNIMPPADTTANDDDDDEDKPAAVKKKQQPRPYRVQIAAVSRKPAMSYFNILTETYPQYKLREIIVGNITHYTYGIFSTFEEAQRWTNLFVALGYSDAFVIMVEKGKITKSFYNNKR